MNNNNYFSIILIVLSLSISRTLAADDTEQPVKRLRPQTPQKPFPYFEELLTFKSQNPKIKLAGTLTLPDDSRKSYPAVVLLQGTGCFDRNQPVYGHQTFLVIADFLTRNGIAVLRYDKRGCGISDGDYESVTLADYADDAQGAINYLESRKEINNQCVGLVGHSQGGLVAPMAAVNKNINTIVMLAGPGMSYQENIMLSEKKMAAINGHTDEFIAQQKMVHQELFNAIITISDQTELKKSLEQILRESKDKLVLLVNKDEKETEEWIEFLVKDYSSPLLVEDFKGKPPEAFLSKLTIPVLAMTGDKDVNVPYPEEINAIEKIFKASGNRQAKIRIYEGLNHMFQPAKTGLQKEVNDIEQTISLEVLDDLREWILMHCPAE
jgi:uncharacterized protein